MTVPALSVLVADDMLGNQRIAVTMLRHLGHETQTASDGHEVLDWLRRRHFDLLLLDDHMPGLGGRDVLRTLAGRQSPDVIVVTANDMPDDRHAYRDLGARGHLVKPLRLAELAHAIARLSRAAPGRQKRGEAGPVPPIGIQRHQNNSQSPVTHSTAGSRQERRVTGAT